MHCLHFPQINPVATETAGDMAPRERGTLTGTRSSSPLSPSASGPHEFLSLSIHLRADILYTLDCLCRAPFPTRIAHPTEPSFPAPPAYSLANRSAAHLLSQPARISSLRRVREGVGPTVLWS